MSYLLFLNLQDRRMNCNGLNKAEQLHSAVFLYGMVLGRQAAKNY